MMTANEAQQPASRTAARRARPVLSALTGLACAGLIGCAPPQPLPRSVTAPPPPPPGPQALGQYVPAGNTLAEARAACNERFPEKVGNYLAHAHCVNLAVEWFALPKVRHADLLRLQERVREKLSEKIDQGQMTPQEGAAKMARADRLIDEAINRREIADRDGAARKVAEAEALLQ